MNRKRWTRRRVFRELLAREAAGLPINHVAVLRKNPGLHAAALRLFGNWPALISAAGLTPERVRCHRVWSRKAVVKRIRERFLAGEPLHMSAIQHSESVLQSAALRWFGSWNDALDAAGLDPQRWRRKVPNWTRERIIKGIKEIHAEGGKLNHYALRRNSITQAGVVLFGSWERALRAAGFDPKKIRLYRRPWTMEEIPVAIRRKHRAREPLNAKDVSPHSLRSAAVRFFGCWDEALRAAGLDPTRIRLNRWKTAGRRRRRK